MVGKKSTLKVGLHIPLGIKADRYLYLSCVKTGHWRPAPSGNPGWSWSLLIAVYNLLTLMCVSP